MILKSARSLGWDAVGQPTSKPLWAGGPREARPGGRMCARKDRKKEDVLGDTVPLDHRSVGKKLLR